MDSIERAAFVTRGLLSIFVLLLVLDKPSGAQETERKTNILESVALCNGIDRSSPEIQIDGCTSIINLGQHSTAAAIAYNNRGDAYAKKGDYDRAIIDFDQSIKLNPTNAKPYNNRGVAYFKKGGYILAMETFHQAVQLVP